MHLLLLLLLLCQIWQESSSEKDPEFWINVEEMVTLQEGLCVSIPCSFHYSQQHKNNNTAHGYWFQRTKQDKLVATSDTQQDVQSWAQSRFHLIGDPQMGNCSLSITGVQKQDHGNYWFQVEKGDLRYNYTSKMLFVRVEGEHSVPGKSLGVMGSPEQYSYQRNGTEYKEGTPLLILEGESLKLDCAAASNPPATLSWSLGDRNLTSLQTSYPGVLSLEMTSLREEDGGEYMCQAHNRLGAQNLSLYLSVQYPPRMLNLSCSKTNGSIFCTCSAQAVPAPSLDWWIGESALEKNSSEDTLREVSITSGTWTNSRLSMKKELNQNLKIRCEGKNQYGVHNLSILLTPGE
ncbi:sialic acid-binding Ig-like lectin 10 [Monodelphis domestica]|uniref:sialic acid-binding Ig-like lectin 10 n=1 Tax=Monodelphis domestica TaxID=13616 RepID=UPI0024E25BF3|nr:sialic acid-binding Ig-like lectin 10 [Monodelphis domestica]